MSAEVTKYPVTREWYDYARSLNEQYLNGLDFFSNDPRLVHLDALSQVETDLLLGRAVLV